MSKLKQFIKTNSHNNFFKGLAGFGRALNRFYENRNHNILSNGELTVIKKLGQIKPEVIIDGGANIGKYALLLHRYNPESKIYAFEPVQKTFEILSEQVRHTKQIIPVLKGLYSEEKKTEINIFNSHTHSSLYNIEGISYSAEDKQIIDLIKGDDFLRANNIDRLDFLKIDVEGAEYDALLGFENSINKGLIKAIQFEYGYINITTKKLLIDFHKFFESKGYVLGKIYPKTVEFRTYKFLHEDFLGPNFIAVKKTEQKLIDILSKK
jgi:FkbM family methyltransferase